jgi:RsiW-degrading membrane proteinase PrsW (M82 family)
MSDVTPYLLLFTLIGVPVIAVAGYAFFLRKRSNRHPVETPENAGHTMAPTESDQR